MVSRAYAYAAKQKVPEALYSKIRDQISLSCLSVYLISVCSFFASLDRPEAKLRGDDVEDRQPISAKKEERSRSLTNIKSLSRFEEVQNLL